MRLLWFGGCSWACYSCILLPLAALAVGSGGAVVMVDLVKCVPRTLRLRSWLDRLKRTVRMRRFQPAQHEHPRRRRSEILFLEGQQRVAASGGAHWAYGIVGVCKILNCSLANLVDPRPILANFMYPVATYKNLLRGVPATTILVWGAV